MVGNVGIVTDSEFRVNHGIKRLGGFYVYK